MKFKKSKSNPIIDSKLQDKTTVKSKRKAKIKSSIAPKLISKELLNNNNNLFKINKSFHSNVNKIKDAEKLNNINSSKSRNSRKKKVQNFKPKKAKPKIANNISAAKENLLDSTHEGEQESLEGETDTNEEKTMRSPQKISRTENPGTIQSDDEVECSSDEDEEEGTELICDGDANFFSDFNEFCFSGVKNSLDTIIGSSRKGKDVPNKVKILGGEQCITTEAEGDEIKVSKKTLKLKEKKNKQLLKNEQHKLASDKVKFNFEDAPELQELPKFSEMNISDAILKAIRDLQYTIPTPIQASTINTALNGRDIYGCSSTGTGKTAAFMIPVLERLLFKPDTDVNVTRVLVLVPTRELGAQVYDVTKSLSKYTEITVALAVGGVDKEEQESDLAQLPDILVATPGRLIDHIYTTKRFSMKDIEILILDEADRMLDKYFLSQLKEIVSKCDLQRQTMLFSATMNDDIKDLISISLKDPVRVFVNSNTDVAQNLRQEYVIIKNNSESTRLAVFCHLIYNCYKDDVLVFTLTKKECRQLCILLQKFDLSVGQLHGDLDQKQRFNALAKFKRKETNILIASDVAARGLDIKKVQTVINYRLPTTYSTYVHRVGRTARAGMPGNAVSLSAASGAEFAMLRKIKKGSRTPVYKRVIQPSMIKELKNKVVNLLTEVERNVEHLEEVVKEKEKKTKVKEKPKKDMKKKEKAPVVKKYEEESDSSSDDDMSGVTFVEVDDEGNEIKGKKALSANEYFTKNGPTKRKKNKLKN